MNTWKSYCQQKYYLVYVLGLEDAPNIKTEKGTVVHAVFEILAGMKKSFQDTGKYKYEHPGMGIFECSASEFMKPYTLSNEEIDFINKTRKNKDTYKDQIKVEYGHVRYGVVVVDSILKKAYDYYSTKSKHDWGNIEWRDCLNFTWMTLDWSNGAYDPRKRTVFYPEYPFNIEIKKDWAKTPDGKHLRIKGTIDLITKIDSNTLEIVDWKTGQRYDWGKGKIKEYEDLMKDEQLMLYYYAARQSFPEYDNILFTIFFLRDGGPFTLCFDDSIIPTVEKNIKETFEEIKTCKSPKRRDPLHKDFQCKTLCGFFKNKIDGIPVCDYISNEIDVYGISKASLKHRREGFHVSNYQNPGE